MSMQEQPVFTTEITAAADLTEHHFVNFAGAVPTTHTKTLGVVALNTLSGQQAPVHVTGIALVAADGTSAIGVGDAVMTDGSGVAIKRTGTYPINGYALDALPNGTGYIRIKLC